MKRVALAWAFIFMPVVAYAHLEITVSLTKTSGTSVRSRGEVFYLDSFGNPTPTDLTFHNWIRNSSLVTVASGGSVHVRAASYLQYVDAFNLAYTCYTARVAASDGDGFGNEQGSAQVCLTAPSPAPAPAPQPCTSTDPTVCAGGGGGSGGGGTQTKYSDDCYYNVMYGQVCNSPLVINVGYGPYRFSGLDAAVAFDLDADGNSDLVAWTDHLSDIAFIVLDRNGNGTIDNGAELFGNHTPKADATIAINGFDALGDLDTNHDGAVDAADSLWSRLRLWIDRDHDARSTSDELFLPGELGVTSLGLDYRWTGRRDQNGNMLRYRGTCTRDGTPTPYYDVYLQMVK